MTIETRVTSQSRVGFIGLGYLGSRVARDAGGFPIRCARRVGILPFLKITWRRCELKPSPKGEGLTPPRLGQSIFSRLSKLCRSAYDDLRFTFDT